MSNLGGYQRIVTASKKVGGPGILVGLIFFVGSIAALTVEHSAIGKQAVRLKTNVFDWASREAKTMRKKRRAGTKIYRLKESTKCADGVALGKNDEFRVLAEAGEAVLIEILGRANNPHIIARSNLTGKTIPEF